MLNQRVLELYLSCKWNKFYDLYVPISAVIWAICLVISVDRVNYSVSYECYRIDRYRYVPSLCHHGVTRFIVTFIIVKYIEWYMNILF